MLSNNEQKKRYDEFIGNLVAATFEFKDEDSRQNIEESFYQRILKKNSEPIFDKEIDLDEELRKLEQMKLNR